MSGVIVDIVINIIASILYFVLGVVSLYFLRKLRAWSKTRLISTIYNDKTLVIALTTRNGPFSQSTPRVSFAEVDAIINLKALVGNKIHIDLLKHPHETTILSEKNILSLGGPLANLTAAQALESLKHRLPFVFQVEPSRKIVIAERVYAPVYSKDGDRIIQDYAVIIKAENPFTEIESTSKKIFMMMGLHGYGTRGAVLAMTDAIISKEIWRKVNTGNFSAVIRIDIDKNQRLSVFLEEVWGT